jgi:hypothetical protein
MKTLYIIVAYRWGNRSDHSYVVGVTGSKSEAIKSAESHTSYRGGKYSCTVEEFKINDLDNERDKYGKIIFRTESLMDQHSQTDLD